MDRCGERYKVGQEVVGTILKVNPFGLFVELDKDIHGLAHVSQLNLANGQKINSVYNVGDKVTLNVATIEPNEHRLGLEFRARKEGKGRKIRRRKRGGNR